MKTRCCCNLSSSSHLWCLELVQKSLSRVIIGADGGCSSTNLNFLLAPNGCLESQQPIGGQESLTMGRRQLSEVNVAAGGALPILPASPCTLVSRSSIRGVRGRGCPTILTFLSSLAIHPLFLQFAGFSTDFLHQSSNSDQ